MAIVRYCPRFYLGLMYTDPAIYAVSISIGTGTSEIGFIIKHTRIVLKNCC